MAQGGWWDAVPLHQHPPNCQCPGHKYIGKTSSIRDEGCTCIQDESNGWKNCPVHGTLADYPTGSLEDQIKKIIRNYPNSSVPRIAALVRAREKMNLPKNTGVEDELDKAHSTIEELWSVLATIRMIAYRVEGPWADTIITLANTAIEDVVNDYQIEGDDNG